MKPLHKVFEYYASTALTTNKELKTDLHNAVNRLQESLKMAYSSSALQEVAQSEFFSDDKTDLDFFDGTISLAPLGDSRLDLYYQYKGRWHGEYAVVFSGYENYDQRKKPAEYISWLKSTLTNSGYIFDDLGTSLKINLSNGVSLYLKIFYRIGRQYETAYSFDQWEYQDPEEYFNWLNDAISQKGEQLKRVIQLFKQWYFNKLTQNQLLPILESSMLTILAVQFFSKSDLDDTAFKNTCGTMLNKFKSGVKCFSPTTPKNFDFFYDLSDAQRQAFLNELTNLFNTGTQASNALTHKEAALKWGFMFGNSFSPAIERASEIDKLEQPNKSEPATITKSARSA